MKLIALPILAIALVAAVSCAGGDDAALGEDVLVKADGDVLTVSDLRAAMPGGLTSDDSTRFARIYIRNWIDRRLARRIAADEIDMTEIDRLVDDYRHELIMRQYAMQMFESHVDTAFSIDTLRAYYDANPKDFALQRPVVKGVYLKIPVDAPNLSTIRKLYRSTRQADIDRLEKEVLRSAVHYDYFRDDWIDWEQVETRIPYNFDSSADAFLRQRDHLDFSDGSFVYLLEISDYKPTGSLMPFEAAKPLIRRRLMARRRLDYERTLRELIYARALSSGNLVMPRDLGL